LDIQITTETVWVFTAGKIYYTPYLLLRSIVAAGTTTFIILYFYSCYSLIAFTNQLKIKSIPTHYQDGF